MRVVQATFGVFHQFELAREMEARGLLDRIYTTWPWARVRREGIPQEKVSTFPWIHTPEYLLRRFSLLPTWLSEWSGHANAIAFDRWTLARAPACDVLVALSGAALLTGRRVQRDGGVFICDRGSSHERFAHRILAEEYRRWGVTGSLASERTIAREEEIYQTADAITVASRFSVQSFLAMGVPASKLHAIPYGVWLERYSPAVEAPSYADGFQVLFVGGVSLRKGVPYLLQAFAQVKASRKRLRIVGAVQPELRQVLAQLPQEHVEFLGATSRDDVVKAMQSSHVMVLPSIEDGFGLVLVEAMACGCPVIGSENTGAPDLIANGVEGFLFTARDVPALTSRLQLLADSPELQARMRLRSLERVQALGGWQQYGDAWEALLRRLTTR